MGNCVWYVLYVFVPINYIRPVLSLSVLCFDFRLLLGLDVFILFFIIIHSFMDCTMLVMVRHLPVLKIPLLPWNESVPCWVVLSSPFSSIWCAVL